MGSIRLGPAASSVPVIAVASGKGGVGKSTFVANVAVALAQQGRRVLVLDADFSLANLDVLLGLAPRYTIQHFFTGECSLADLVIEGPAGIHLIPAASGVVDLARIDPRRRRDLAEGLQAIRLGHDVVLIDAPAGIGDNVVQVVGGADRILVVAAPEPTSLVDAYATIKVLAAEAALCRIGLVVNGARDAEQTRAVHGQIDRVCRRFLGGGIDLAGEIVHDDRVAEAVREQRAVVELHPNCAASRCFRSIAGSLLRSPAPEREQSPLWDRLFAAAEGTPVH